MYAITEFESLNQIRDRYLEYGYKECLIHSLRELFYDFMSKEELKRVSKLEWMDEYEEFDLMHSHYFVSIAKKYAQSHLEIKSFGFDCLNK